MHWHCLAVWLPRQPTLNSTTQAGKYLPFGKTTSLAVIATHTPVSDICSPCRSGAWSGSSCPGQGCSAVLVSIKSHRYHRQGGCRAWCAAAMEMVVGRAGVHIVIESCMDLFTSLWIRGNEKSSNSNTKMVSWSSQDRVVLSVAFRKSGPLLVQVDLRKKCEGLTAGYGLVSIFKLSILNLKYWLSIINRLGLFSWTNGKNKLLKQI